MKDQKVMIVRGTTTPLYIDLLGPEGELLQMSEGDRLLMGVIPVFGGDRLLTKAAESDGNGGYVFILEPADTVGIPSAEYRYDVNWEHGEEFLNVVPLSTFVVMDTTTEMGIEV